MKYFVEMVGGTHEVELVERLGELIVKVDGEPMNFDYHEIDLLGQVVATHDGQSYALSVEGGKSKVRVTLAGHTYAMELEDASALRTWPNARPVVAAARSRPSCRASWSSTWSRSEPRSPRGSRC